MIFKTQFLAKTWRLELELGSSSWFKCPANPSCFEHQQKQNKFTGMRLLLLSLFCFYFHGGIHFLYYLPPVPSSHLCVCHSGQDTLRFSRNSVYMRCSHEKKGQGLGPRNLDSSHSVPLARATDSITFLQVRVRLMSFRPIECFWFHSSLLLTTFSVCKQTQR